MNRFFLSCTLVFVTATTTIGQSQADSLRRLLKTAYQSKDTANIIYRTYLLGYYYSGVSKPDSAIRYFHDVLEIKKPVPLDYRGITLNWLGIHYERIGFPDSSLLYYHDALKAFEEMPDTTRAIDVESNIAIIYKNFGMYEKALSTSHSTLGRLRGRKPDRALASCYNTIGAVHVAMKDYTEALEYYRKALNVRKKIGYTKGIGQSYNNIGEVFNTVENYDSALANLNQALIIKRSLGDSSALPSTMTNIGDVLIKVGKTDEARKYLVASLALLKSSNDKRGQIASLNTLARGLLRKNDLLTALHYLDEAYTIATQTKSLEYLRNNLEIRIDVYEALNNHSAALLTAKQLLIVKDSLVSQEKMSRLRSADVTYMAKMLEQQIEILNKEKNLHQAEIKAQGYWILVLTLGITLAVVIALFVYNNFRTSRKNERRIAFLLKELHHRVKNNLQILSSVLSLQSQHLTDEKAIQAVKSNEGRINAMALIHRKLYTEETNQNINISEYITELIQYLVYTYGFHDRELKLHMSIEPVSVDVDKAIPMGLILNELISNAFKYAYVAQDSPELNVTLRQQTTGDVEISIRDNGSGMAIDSPTTDGERKFGLKMINTLIKDLKGKYSIHVEKGTTYTLNIPLI